MAPSANQNGTLANQTKKSTKRNRHYSSNHNNNNNNKYNFSNNTFCENINHHNSTTINPKKSNCNSNSIQMLKNHKNIQQAILNNNMNGILGNNGGSSTCGYMTMDIKSLGTRNYSIEQKQVKDKLLELRKKQKCLKNNASSLCNNHEMATSLILNIIKNNNSNPGSGGVTAHEGPPKNNNFGGQGAQATTGLGIGSQSESKYNNWPENSTNTSCRKVNNYGSNGSINNFLANAGGSSMGEMVNNYHSVNDLNSIKVQAGNPSANNA